jgi:hypothetical protein
MFILKSNLKRQIIKKIFITFLLLTSFAGFSQNFTYKKVLSMGQILKINGSITLSDSTVTISTKGQPNSVFKSVKTTDSPEYKQYKLELGEGYEGRISVNLTKGIEVLILEIKDLFSGTVSSTNYFLIPEKESDKK